jgi:predicted glutamine amidotransferase
MITDDVIKTMFVNNPNGAGFMFNYNGSVEIHKGYMKVTDLLKALTDVDKRLGLTDKTLVLHFRIGTAGDNSPSNTHPFPVSHSLSCLQKTRTYVPLAVVHNGIISSVSPRNKTISDTMEFIMTVMSPLRKMDAKFYLNEDAKKLIYNLSNSKFAFLDSDGNYSTIGEFNTVDDVLFSNYSYYPYETYYNRDYWDKYTTDTDVKLMMLLDDDDGYIQLLDGTLISCIDYLLAEDGTLYEYDYSKDVAVKSYDTLRNHNGSNVKFNIDRADYYYINGGYSYDE